MRPKKKPVKFNFDKAGKSNDAAPKATDAMDSDIEVDLMNAFADDVAQDVVAEVLDAPQTINHEAAHKEAHDRYHRTLAEFDNFRKRTSKEMAVRYDDGVRSVCEKLLPLIDNFERALNAQAKQLGDKDDPFYQGVQMIARQFDTVLTSIGIEPIDANTGDPFDPNFHNAVAHVEDNNLGSNVVSEVLQKGYKHRDKVLRHSMVKAAN